MDEERLMGSVNLSVSKQPVDIRDFDCEMLQRVQKKQSLCKLLEGFFWGNENRIISEIEFIESWSREYEGIKRIYRTIQ